MDGAPGGKKYSGSGHRRRAWLHGVGGNQSLMKQNIVSSIMETNNIEWLRNTLRAYFSQFGDIFDCAVINNPQCGKSRGFVFVTFMDFATADIVQSSKMHLTLSLLVPECLLVMVVVKTGLKLVAVEQQQKIFVKPSVK
ncbi:hypothetical protein BsWGS_07649 [Bradybaena similaris]